MSKFLFKQFLSLDLCFLLKLERYSSIVELDILMTLEGVAVIQEQSEGDESFQDDSCNEKGRGRISGRYLQHDGSIDIGPATKINDG
jgi:hypothetical protein